MRLEESRLDDGMVLFHVSHCLLSVLDVTAVQTPFAYAVALVEQTAFGFLPFEGAEKRQGFVCLSVGLARQLLKEDLYIHYKHNSSHISNCPILLRHYYVNPPLF
jgi:hypothetical protein